MRPEPSQTAKTTGAVRWRLSGGGEAIMMAGALIGLLGLLAFMPLVIVAWFSLTKTVSGAAVFTVANYVRTFTEAHTYALLYNTLVFTVASVPLGALIGVGFAWLLERTNTPLRKLGSLTMVLSVSLPALLFAIAWTLALNPRTGVLNLPFIALLGWSQGPFSPRNMETMVWLQAVRSSGTVFLIVAGLFRSMDSTLEEAASVAGAGAVATALRVTLPLLLPGILGAVIYVTSSTMGAFDIPTVIGVPAGIPVLATAIYNANNAVPPDYGFAASLASPTGIIGFAAILLYHRVTRLQSRYATITGKSAQPRRIELSRAGRIFGGGIVGVMFLLLVGLPLVVLLWTSLLPFYQAPSLHALRLVQLNAYRDLFVGPASSNFLSGLGNTLILATVVPAAAVLLAALVSWMVIRRRVRMKGLIDGLAFLPHTVPVVVLGLAWVLFGVYVGFIPIYGTIWIIALAQISAFLPYATRATNGAVLQVHRDLEDAGVVSGARFPYVFRRILLPLFTPPLATAALWVSIQATGDLTLSMLLSNTDNQPISIYIWSNYLNGYLNRAAAAAIVLLALIALFVGGAHALTGRAIPAQQKGQTP